MARRGSSLVTAGVLFAAVLALAHLSGAFVSYSPLNTRKLNTARRFFESELGLAKEEKTVDKDGKEIKSRLSPGDNFQMPQTEQEEEKAEYWRSDFDDLPDSEKVTSPAVIIALLTVIVPFVIGGYVLITSANA
mmetsp:Transcript_4069/g.11778  ORF Transcript_4069/g.11778 Transcript_4069/m.11778 type:complete len:134 (+) Transcript_4069:73-474(+)